MPVIADHLDAYLHETLGVSLSLVPWPGAARLPPFMGQRYRFLRALLLDQEVIFMVDRATEEQPPATIQKHIAQVRTKWDQLVVYVRERITAYNRKRLIHNGVAFVVPGNQMYLPELGLDLREHFRKLEVQNPHFRPSTQAVLIHLLLRDSDKPLVATKLAPELGYTAMTMSRAFDEIESAGLGTSEFMARERRLKLAGSPGEVWNRAQSLLRDPVGRRHHVEQARGQTPGLRAGLDALARYSMLAEPENTVFAMSRTQWKSLRQRGTVQVLALREPDALEIEVWRYPPRSYRDPSMVDPLSLFLSLRDATDERVESALEHMMERLEW